MTDDWQIGDKALCVHSGRATREGRVYTVSYVKAPGERLEGSLNNFPNALLRFVEIGGEGPLSWSHPVRFRKVLPDRHEPCEAEFVTLLKRTKVGATLVAPDVVL